MRWGVGWRTGALAAAAFYVAASLGARWEQDLVVQPVDGVMLYGNSEAETSTSNGATQRLRALPTALQASYTYKNFNGDRITVEFQLGKTVFQNYEASFGYYKKDLAAIDEWHNNARQGAYKYALTSHKSQDQLNAALANLEKEHTKKIHDYMSARGFRIMTGNVVTVDVPGVVKRNAPILNSVAKAIDSVATQRQYDSEAIIGAGASLVQTAIIYRVPDDVDPDGRHNGGILQPATTLLRGWGDCDTKTALLASILANWPQMKMVGVAVPEHYLMGVLRIANKGDAFVEHEGLQYVLIEPAGPAWLQPGQVADSTVALLNGSEGFRIDPFF
jgi:hypothetical protein